MAIKTLHETDSVVCHKIIRARSNLDYLCLVWNFIYFDSERLPTRRVVDVVEFTIVLVFKN